MNGEFRLMVTPSVQNLDVNDGPIVEEPVYCSFRKRGVFELPADISLLLHYAFLHQENYSFCEDNPHIVWGRESPMGRAVAARIMSSLLSLSTRTPHGS